MNLQIGHSGTQKPAKRASRVARTDRLTTLWLLTAALAGALTILSRGILPQPLWTMVHVVTLGVLTNGIFQWSWYFCRALLRLPANDPRAGRDNTIRILCFNATFVLLIVSMWSGWVIGTITGATLVGVIAAWHGLGLVLAARSRLASRFAVVIRYYICAAAFLVLTCVFAGLTTVAMFSQTAPTWLVGTRDTITLAHAISGVGGWVGLTMGGTIITLGPTAIRTRIDPDAVRFSTAALPAWVVGLLTAIAAASFGQLRTMGAGLLLVAVSAGVGIVFPLARTATRKGPSEYGAWSMCLGVAWILVGVLAVAAATMTQPDATALRAANLSWLPVIGLGGLGQVFMGALVYLMPVVIGGGPSIVRQGVTTLESWAPARETARNLVVALLAMTTVTNHQRIQVACWILLLATYIIDIALIAVSGVRQTKAARAARSHNATTPTRSTTAGGTHD